MTVLLAMFAARTPVVGKLVDSVRTFDRQFHSLKSAQSMSPIERFVLSLVMTS